MSQSRKKIKKLQKERRQRHQDTLKRKEKAAVRQQSEQAHDEVLEDMLPLFSPLSIPSAASKQSLEELMKPVIISEDLADEPEFEGILISPLICTETFTKVGQEIGLSPEEFESLPAEEREDTRLVMFEKSLQQLLTAELCEDILKRLNDLRLRLKQSGKKKETAKVAALLSFLRKDEDRSIWPMIGLVQAIFQRSLRVGFEMIEASIDVSEPDAGEGKDTSMTDKLKKPGPGKKIKNLLKKTPGLREYLEKEADKVWEKGMEAILAGDLQLGIYSLEELEAGIEIIATVSGFDSDKAMLASDPSAWKFPDDKAKTLVTQLDSFITKLFTRARLGQLREKMNTLMKDPQYKGEWFPFILLLKEHLADKKAVEYEKKFLIYAFFGELRGIEKEVSESD
ncbi:MAG: hypothetical protein QMD04_09320 [Anaerolineales bacterium]|nr:hypothetical protein [Anaerolineales bacterium]